MKKFSLIVTADIIAFIAFVFLTTTGVLLHYSLPPGSGHSNTIWGLDRHEWGTVHFWIAVSFLAILSFHLLLHIRWIKNVAKGRNKKYQTPRMALGLVGIAALIALAISPLLTPVTQETNVVITSDRPTRINGSMTLKEIELATGVPTEYLLKQLNLPVNTNKDKRLGHLRRAYGFELNKVRQIIKSYKN